MTETHNPQIETSCTKLTSRTGTLTRRALISTAASLALASLIPARVFASPSAGKELYFFNIHTAERLEFFHIPGQCSTQTIKRLNYFLRDFRTGDVHPIDRKLLDSLALIAKLSGKKANYEVISGYRSPKTNAMLHRISSGVSTHSLHMQGRAIDIRLDGVPLSAVHKIALNHHNGGVGYYPQSDFIHLDTGRKRYW